MMPPVRTSWWTFAANTMDSNWTWQDLAQHWVCRIVFYKQLRVSRLAVYQKNEANLGYTGGTFSICEQPQFSVPHRFLCGLLLGWLIRPYKNSSHSLLQWQTIIIDLRKWHHRFTKKNEKSWRMHWWYHTVGLIFWWLSTSSSTTPPWEPNKAP